jgi:general secretion pathway protein H
MQTSETGVRLDEGFALLELLVVLLIMGVISTTGASLLTGGSEQKMNRRATLIVEFARTARRCALASGKAQTLAINGAHLTISPAGLILKRKDVTMTGLFENKRPDRLKDAIVFYPDGSSSGGTLSLSSGNEKRHVNVDWWGGARVDH